jgi:hypothetical protein
MTGYGQSLQQCSKQTAVKIHCINFWYLTSETYKLPRYWLSPKICLRRSHEFSLAFKCRIFTIMYIKQHSKEIAKSSVNLLQKLRVFLWRLWANVFHWRLFDTSKFFGKYVMKNSCSRPHILLMTYHHRMRQLEARVGKINTCIGKLKSQISYFEKRIGESRTTQPIISASIVLTNSIEDQKSNKVR